MPKIVLPDWYQFDFVIRNPNEDLEEVSVLIKKLGSDALISRWFFLWEGKTIRIRLQATRNSDMLKKRVEELSAKHKLKIDENFPFSQYVEEIFPNEEVMRRFANIMSEVTQLTVKKINKETNFDNYRILERISHCLFNNVAGLIAHSRGKSEEHFLVQRLMERCRQGFDADFELEESLK